MVIVRRCPVMTAITGGASAFVDSRGVENHTQNLAIVTITVRLCLVMTAIACRCRTRTRTYAQRPRSSSGEPVLPPDGAHCPGGDGRSRKPDRGRGFKTSGHVRRTGPSSGPSTGLEHAGAKDSTLADDWEIREVASDRSRPADEPWACCQHVERVGGFRRLQACLELVSPSVSMAFMAV
ncbi:hypothetical protein DCS_05766 [Drechmeria coniospora]|uniref:Uncharacterized protein n=1 Tax=Drechmeria coniospora TaxID=98403 RepID=A0A151GNU9_DRECN|nr:hypothetical protein DCS_05766 [Drechmeria coniospora]KYK58748.1 hypothetical protein DCS_05766 [Drechmeria coniospora]